VNTKVSEPALGLALIYAGSKCVRNCWRQNRYCCSSGLYDGVGGGAVAADGSKSHCCSKTKGRRPRNDNYGCPVAFGTQS
jgi:hypothetical protein